MDLVESTETGIVGCVWVIAGPYLQCVTLSLSHSGTVTAVPIFVAMVMDESRSRSGHVDKKERLGPAGKRAPISPSSRIISVLICPVSNGMNFLI